MKKKICLAAQFCVLLIIPVSCLGTPKTNTNTNIPHQLEPFAAYAPRTVNAPFTILDYEKKNTGQPLPAWAAIWLAGGSAALEELPAYAGKYCFVMEQSGSNLQALLRWVEGFHLEQTFPKMALQRIFQRWTMDSALSPDVQYGSYFIKMLKAYMTYFRPEAELGGIVWLLIRYTPNVNGPADDGDEVPLQGDAYRVLVLAVCDKLTFQTAMSAALNGISYARTDSRAQINAVEQTRGNFWIRF